MNDMDNELSPEQWHFLAVLYCFHHPLPIDLISALAPLSAGKFWELMRFCSAGELVAEKPQNHLVLNKHIDHSVLLKLKRVCSADFQTNLAGKIRRLNLENQLPENALAHLFLMTGEKSRAGVIELELAAKKAKTKDYEAAIQAYLRGLRLISDQLGIDELDVVFLSAVQDLFHLMLPMGRFLGEIPELMEVALNVATRRGDKRSQAMLSLQLGFLYVASDRRDESFELFDFGYKLVHELGDDDIFEASNHYFAHFEHAKGNLQKAAKLSHQAALTNEANASTKLFDAWPAIFTGYLHAFIGDFHFAVGYLAYLMAWARRRELHSQAMLIQACLGVILLQVHKEEEAHAYLKKVVVEFELHQNHWAKYVAESGLAIYYCRKNRLSEAANWIIHMRNTPWKAGIKRQFNSPWVLEVLYELEEKGYDLPHDFSFTSKYNQIKRESYIHMQGVALRLLAKQASEGNEDHEVIKHYLLQSENLQKNAGDPTELAKTRLDLSALFLKEGNRREAARLAADARNGLSKNIRAGLFPDHLKALIETSPSKKEHKAGQIDFWNTIIELKKDLKPIGNIDEMMNNVVAVMNHFFKSERGGLFWKDSETGHIQFKTGVNLSASNVSVGNFRYNFQQIKKCISEGVPVVSRKASNIGLKNHEAQLKILCIPILSENQVKGVLYQDNLYLEGFFNDFPLQQLITVSMYLSILFDAAFEYNSLLRKTRIMINEESGRINERDEEKIIFKSFVMKRLLERTDQVAATEGTVLILGETGVGKELLARRIHRAGPRRSKRIITVDLTAVPDNLIESDLFGHEKGAFTGADKRKLGRLELADGGTLFIDELGEIPKHIQAKLLRVLQERTFRRIGGHSSIHSDFRLIAATNRDLTEKIKRGLFRKDLFFRLNTIPFSIPPLRDRQEDIEPIANFFLTRFCRKYNRQQLVLTPSDIRQLKNYSWPGNVRELRNVIERTVIMSSGDWVEISLSHSELERKNCEFELEPANGDGDDKMRFESSNTMPSSLSYAGPGHISTPANVFTVDTTGHMPTLDDIQRRYIKYVMEKKGGRISGPNGIASTLGVKRTTFYGKMKKLGIGVKNAPA